VSENKPPSSFTLAWLAFTGMLNLFTHLRYLSILIDMLSVFSVGLCTLSIHSLLNSLHYTAVADLAADLAADYNIDLIALTETWIKPTPTPAELGDATPLGYSLYSKPVQPLRTTTKVAFWGVD